MATIEDERIVRDRNEIQAWGFKACAAVLLAALFYRQLYLGQHPREHWDLLLALFGSVAYVNITSWARGATKAQGDGATLPRNMRWWRLGLVILWIIALSYWREDMPLETTSDIAKLIASMLAGLVPVLLLFYYLGRRWKRQCGLDEDE